MQDNLPNTVLEALACNVPVVGLKIGGLPDLVVPSRNGFLAKQAKGFSDLAEKISSALELSNSILKKGKISLLNQEDQYTLSSQANSYRMIYDSLN
jgi:glycosyltransferase involved in cell wall biosynthesis